MDNMENIDMVRNEELYEMIIYVIKNNSYLKSKLKDKEVGSEYNINVFEKEIENVNSDVVKDIIKDKMKEIDKLRGEELVRRYGKLILKESVYNKVLNIKKTKK